MRHTIKGHGKHGRARTRSGCDLLLCTIRFHVHEAVIRCTSITLGRYDGKLFENTGGKDHEVIAREIDELSRHYFMYVAKLKEWLQMASTPITRTKA